MRELHRSFPYAILGLLVAASGLAACASVPRSPEKGQVVDARRGRTVRFETMVDDLARVRMVFVGESHTSAEHHEIQRRIIEELSDRNPNLIVGMEMLQRPYQEVLDRWTAGELSEDDFLREVSWFDQWSDWGLYAPILRLCRDRHIRVVGLHITGLGPGGPISRAISREGLENIPPWMRAQLPDVIDTSVEPHRKAIREIFFGHPGMDKMEGMEERFQRFYQSQCSWDETMAESAVMALDSDPRPGAAIVVIAGSMHVKDFHSIPERARRRNGLDYRVVLPLETPEADEAPVRTGPGRAGDYVLFTGPSPGPRSARLGVGIRGGDNLIKMVAEKSAAGEAGLQAGDFLTAIDEFPVRDVVDIKIALDGRGPGEKVRLKWLRDGAPMEGTGTIAAPPSMMGPVRAPAKKEDGGTETKHPAPEDAGGGAAPPK